MVVSIQAVQRKAQLRWLSRTRGCGDVCTDQFGHDPITHEAYGAEQERTRAAAAVLVTGPLTIDLSARIITDTEGRTIWASPIEWKILSVCAQHVGTVVPWRTIISHVYGDTWALETPDDAKKCIRAHLLRLRSRLGPAAPMLQTRPAAGLMLWLLPAGETPPNDGAMAVSGRWSSRYDACIQCGSMQAPHQSRGLCASCYSKKQRRDGRK